MKLLEALRVALSSLTSNKMRTILATLGIAIGIAAVSTLLSIGQSFQRFTMNQFEGLETNALTLMAQIEYGSMTGGAPPAQARLSMADIEALRTLPNITAISPRYTMGGNLKAGSAVSFPTIIGAEPVHLRPNMLVALGRFITDQDLKERARVLVLDWRTAQQLFPDGRPLLREVIVRGLSFRVIGVLGPSKDSLFTGNGSAIVPITVARDRLFPDAALGKVQVTEATIYLKDVSLLSETQMAVSDMLRMRHKLQPQQGNDFSFQNYAQFAKANNNILVGITAFLGVIGGIALLVGGIGIMNIMLVSVAERTREIGLRKAVGARRRDILIQFLVEALLLSLIGGTTGVLFSALLVNGGAIVVHMLFSSLGIGPFMSLDPSAIILALSFSSAVGLVAGIYPAFRASRLAPIEALRTM